MSVFTEKQRFTQWWLWVIIIGVTLIAPLAIVINDPKHGFQAHTATDIIFACIVPVLVIILFLLLQLRTRIDETGIYYRFVPIHFQVLHKSWDDIEKAYIRQYSPLKEYGGWGIRYGMGGKGKAYNVRGNMGLQIELKNGKKMLLGTQKPDEMNEILQQLVLKKIITRKMITA